MAHAQSASIGTDFPSQTSQHATDFWNQGTEHMSDGSEGSEEHDYPSGQSGYSHDHVKKPRNCGACLLCRRQKTRCEYTDEASNGPCKLCVKYNRECIRAPPRRRRQKTAVRIADLEQKIQSLTDALVEKGPQIRKLELSPLHQDQNRPPAAVGNGSTNMNPSESQPRMAGREPMDLDIIEKGLVDKTSAYAAFERYVHKMSRFFVYLAIPFNARAAEFRQQKPLLFSVIVLAGITNVRPDLPSSIANDVMKSFGDRILYRGDRSLELIQCLTIFVCFYSRTLAKKDLNFYQYIHVASTMALDLGLGRRLSRAGPDTRLKISKQEELEGRRAWLGCYYMAVIAAISLRHPTLIRWSPYIEECLHVISTHPQAAPSDASLCDEVRIVRIIEDAATIFSMDDPGSIVSLRDPRTQYQLRALEKQLERWRKDAKHDLSESASRSLYAMANIYIHEIALHSEHDIDKFRSPPLLDEVIQSLEDLDIAPARIDALCTCLSSAHELFNIILELNIDTIRCLPNLFFVRTGYAAIILKSLSDIFESKSWGNAPSHAIDVKFDYYMDTTISFFVEAGQDGRSNIATAFAVVLKQIQNMHSRSRAVEEKIPEVDVIAGKAVPSAISATQAPTASFTAPTDDGLNAYAYAAHKPIPTEFNFNDFDTNMFDVNAYQQVFDPNFNFYDFTALFAPSSNVPTNP